MVQVMTGRRAWLVALTATGGVRWAGSPLRSYNQMSPLSSAKHHRPVSGGGQHASLLLWVGVVSTGHTVV